MTIYEIVVNLAPEITITMNNRIDENADLIGRLAAESDRPDPFLNVPDLSHDIPEQGRPTMSLKAVELESKLAEDARGPSDGLSLPELSGNLLNVISLPEPFQKNLFTILRKIDDGSFVSNPLYKPIDQFKSTLSHWLHLLFESGHEAFSLTPKLTTASFVRHARAYVNWELRLMMRLDELKGLDISSYTQNSHEALRDTDEMAQVSRSETPKSTGAAILKRNTGQQRAFKKAISGSFNLSSEDMTMLDRAAAGARARSESMAARPALKLDDSNAEEVVSRLESLHGLTQLPGNIGYDSVIIFVERAFVILSKQKRKEAIDNGKLPGRSLFQLMASIDNELQDRQRKLVQHLRDLYGLS